MYYRANMETFRLILDHPRRLVDANFVHRHVGELGRLTTFTPRTHFLYFHLEGERYMGDAEEEFEIRPGDVILFHGNRAYDSYRPTTSYRAMNLLFEPEDADEWRPGREIEDWDENDRRLPLLGRLHVGNAPAFRTRFEETVLLCHSPAPLRRRQAAALLETILIDLAARSRPTSSRHRATVDFLVGYIEKNLEQKLDLDELADLVGMSRRNLTRRFREATGRSIQAYQLERRLRLAMSILATHPEITLAEVANMLGFYDAYHFGRLFKRQIGIAPKAWQKTQTGKSGLSS